MPQPDQIYNRTNVGAFDKMFTDCQPNAIKFSNGVVLSSVPTVEERLSVLESKMDQILAKLNLIFGDQVLINGQFCSTNSIGQNSIPLWNQEKK